MADVNGQSLSERYRITPEMTTTEVQHRLKAEEDCVRKEIQKLLKMKEAVEKIRQASTGQKSGRKSDIGAEIKRLNARLEVLSHELDEIRTFQLIASDGSASLSRQKQLPGRKQFSSTHFPDFFFCVIKRKLPI